MIITFTAVLFNIITQSGAVELLTGMFFLNSRLGFTWYCTARYHRLLKYMGTFPIPTPIDRALVCCRTVKGSEKRRKHLSRLQRLQRDDRQHIPERYESWFHEFMEAFDFTSQFPTANMGQGKTCSLFNTILFATI